MKRNGRICGFLSGALTMLLVFSLVTPSLAVLAGKTIEVLTGITIYVNGAEMKPTDANGKPVETFVYNGTTYVPLRAVSQSLGYNVQYDGPSQSVYIGDDPRMTNYLVDVCPPYSQQWYEAPDTFKMGGKTYTHGFTFNGNGAATYNLNGQYDALEFDLGPVDGADSRYTANITIYLDGSVVKTVDVEHDDLPIHISLPLNRALQMKIVCETHNYGNDYGFANAILY